MRISNFEKNEFFSFERLVFSTFRGLIYMKKIDDKEDLYLRIIDYEED